MKTEKISINEIIVDIEDILVSNFDNILDIDSILEPKFDLSYQN